MGGEQGTPARKKLGEIFVEKGILTPVAVDRALALSRRHQKRFGTVLEELGFVTGEELAQALSEQYGVRFVPEFAKYPFPPELLQLVPVQAAVEHSIFPLKVADAGLALAMVDPTLDVVVKGIEERTKLRIARFLATRLELNRAICRHYLGREYAAAPNAGNTILIVDDDKLIRTSLSAMLSQKGYSVATAENGLTAFNEIVAVRPDVIITDKEMPKRDGYQLLDSLKQIPHMKDTPVLLITSSSSPEDEARAYDRGFFDFISKPFFSIVVEAKVRRALRGRRTVS